jgi:dTDP-4-amino-4,6-dideoxygalactose transaminase
MGLGHEPETALLPEARSEGLTDRVPFFDLSSQYEELREEILEVFDRVCRDGDFVLGTEVDAFEREFAEYCEVRHCVALGSGTAALHLALLAAGVGTGDEVVTSPATFVATAEAITFTGARPVFADVSASTVTIDPAAIQEAMTERTKAIVPVHLYGRPADMAGIFEVVGRSGVAVIEDACQAHGARVGGRKAGTLGVAGAFSFYPSKNLGAFGDAGALVTDDDRVADVVRSLRDHGQRGRYVHDSIGFNYRMDGLQAAVLRIKLRQLDRWTARRKELARLYREVLSGARVHLPVDDPQAPCVYHLFTAQVEDRDWVRSALEARGVGTSVHYPLPVHLQPAYASLGLTRGTYPNAERAFDRTLSLPLFPEMTDAQACFAASALSEIVGPA